MFPISYHSEHCQIMTKHRTHKGCPRCLSTSMNTVWQDHYSPHCSYETTFACRKWCGGGICPCMVMKTQFIFTLYNSHSSIQYNYFAPLCTEMFNLFICHGNHFGGKTMDYGKINIIYINQPVRGVCSMGSLMLYIIGKG